MPKTLILDSTQLTAFYECPQMWNYSHNQNITIQNEVRDDIAMGSMFHKLIEIYLTERGQWPSNSPQAALAVKKANDFDVDVEDRDESDEHGFPLDPDKRQIVRDRFKDYLLVYGENDYKTFMKQKYAIKFKDGLPYDSFENVPLVEQGFSYKLFESKEYLFVLEGKVDWIINLNGQPAWVDHKTQGREKRLYPKRIQFRNYALATNTHLAVINYVRWHKKMNDNTFVRDPISFSALELQWWKQELIEKYIEIVNMRDSGIFKHEWDNCEGKYGYNCQYTDLCEERNPDSLVKIKASKYVQKVEWKPW